MEGERRREEVREMEEDSEIESESLLPAKSYGHSL